VNTRDLAYYVQLVELGNFTRVADQFGVTQPTITLAIKRLEDEFGVTLIHRDQSHAALTVTAAGQQLYRHARTIGQELALTHTEIAHLKEEKIRFGLPPIIGNYYFPKIAGRLVAAGLTEHLLTQSGSIDIALLGSSGPLDVPGLAVTPLTDAPFSIVVPPKNLLANQAQVAVAALADQPFVVLNEGFVHDRALRWFTRAADIRPNIVYRSGDVGLVKQMIAQGVGIGFLTKMAVAPADDLVTLPISQAGQPRFVISVAHRADLVLSPMMQALKKILTTAQ
jgi:DNA-binding transcriptional LysR family regulator